MSIFTEDYCYSFLSEFSNSDYPHQLYGWMHQNIVYKHTRKFLSPKEVEKYHYGDCHDQANYSCVKLTSHKISNSRLFVIEYNIDENKYSKIQYHKSEDNKYDWIDAGTTHTVNYYIENYRYYWLENAWQYIAGIHGPYKNINDLKNDVTKYWRYNGYDNLYIGNVNSSMLRYGMSLDDYVWYNLPSDENNMKPYAIYNGRKFENI